MECALLAAAILFLLFPPLCWIHLISVAFPLHPNLVKLGGLGFFPPRCGEPRLHDPPHCGSCKSSYKLSRCAGGPFQLRPPPPIAGAPQMRRIMVIRTERDKSHTHTHTFT